MKQVNWESVGNFALNVAKIAIVGSIVKSIIGGRKTKVVTREYRVGAVNYNDAVQAVMESNIYDNGKKKIITTMKTDGDSEYYASIISIVKSNMYDNARVELVETLSK